MKKIYIVALVIFTVWMYVWGVLPTLNPDQSIWYNIEAMLSPLFVLGGIIGSYFLVKRFRKAKPETKPVSF